MAKGEWYDVRRIAGDTYLIRERLDVLAPFFGVTWVNMYCWSARQARPS